MANPTLPSSNPFPTAAEAEAASASAADAANDAARRAAQSAHDAVDRVAAKAGPVVDKIKTQFDSAAATLQQRAGEITTLQEEWTETARVYVRDKPLQSVGIALAVGWLIGRLTAR